MKNIVLLALSVAAVAMGQNSETSGNPRIDPGTLAAPKQDATTAAPHRSQKEIAAQQVKDEEKQRILGIVPHFNVYDLSEAVRLSPEQKFELAFKSAVDPFNVGLAGINGAIGQAQNSEPGYGQGIKGYGRRFGAAYLDSFDGTMIGNAMLPAVLHQDPRYLRKGTGNVPGRITYALLSTFRCKGDNGRWQPNVSNLLGNFAAGGISNLYYPSSDRGFVNTYQRTIVVSGEGAIGAVLAEFLPDIARHHHRHHEPQP